MGAMAGNPKKRAARAAAEARANELEQALAETLAAGGIPSAGSEDAPARASTKPPRHLRAVAPQAPSPPRTPSGAETRRVADHTAASEIALLGQRLRPGLRVQVERTKPHWCAGIVEEDYIVDAGGVVELLGHLREEWGGQSYRLTVSQPNGSVAFETRVQIAAPPRYHSKDITRASWGGEEPVAVRAQNPAPAPLSNDMFSMFREVFGLATTLQKESSDKHLEAIKNIVANGRAQNQELIEALVKKDQAAAQAAAPRTLAEQLAELSASQRAIEKAGKLFGSARKDSETDDEFDEKGMMKAALGHFMGNLMQSEFAAPNARASRAPAPARSNPPVSPPQMQIPTAGIAGQKAPK